MLIETFQFEENIEIRVFKIRTGYSVTLYDKDVNATLPTIRIFEKLSHAITYAKSFDSAPA